MGMTPKFYANVIFCLRRNIMLLFDKKKTIFNTNTKIGSISVPDLLA